MSELIKYLEGGTDGSITFNGFDSDGDMEVVCKSDEVEIVFYFPKSDIQSLKDHLTKALEGKDV